MPRRGAVAERLGRGLQSLVQRFESARRLFRHLRKLSDGPASMAAMIVAEGLTKYYGEQRAVDDLSFTVQPGVVTGFLGPNGSGKSTKSRLILELDAPTAGDVTVNGKHYRYHAAPLHVVRAPTEARWSTPAVTPTTTSSRCFR